MFDDLNIGGDHSPLDLFHVLHHFENMKALRMEFLVICFELIDVCSQGPNHD